MQIILLVLSSLTVSVVTGSNKTLSIVKNGSQCPHQVTLQCNILQNFSYIEISWENKLNKILCNWTTTSPIKFDNSVSCQYTTNQLTLTIKELHNEEHSYYCKLRTEKHYEGKNISLDVEDCSQGSRAMISSANKAETTTTGLMWLLLFTVLVSFLNLWHLENTKHP